MNNLSDNSIYHSSFILGSAGGNSRSGTISASPGSLTLDGLAIDNLEGSDEPHWPAFSKSSIAISFSR